MANWLDALNTRSLGLNKLYGLGGKPAVSADAATAPVQTPQMTLEEWLRQESSKWLQAQVDAINAQEQAYKDSLRQQQELEIQRGQALSQALQGLNIPGRIQQIYGNASSDIGGLAQAFSGELRDQATADAAQQTRMLSGTGQEGAVPNNGAALGDVLYGSQGYIPARNMSETGAAFASQAALEPGFAQRIGQVKGADVYNQGLEGLKQFTDALLDATAQRPQIEQQLLEQYQKNQEAAQPNLTARSLADGRIQWFDEDTGQPVGPPQGPKRASSSSTAAVKTVRLADGTYQAVDPKTGKPVGNPFGPKKTKSSSSTKLQARSLANGQIQWFDPATGKAVGAPQGPKRATTKKGPGGQTYNLQLKTLADGSQQWFDPRTGRPVGAKISPPKSAKSKFTASQLAKMRGVAYDSAKAAKLGLTNSKGEVVLEPWDGKPGPNKKGPKEVLQDLIGHGIPFRVAVKEVAKFFPVAKKWYDPKAEAAAKGAKAENAAVVEDALNAGPRSGITYVFGGNGKNGGYDCSGYTMAMVAQHTGVDLPHNAAQQFNDPRGVAVGRKDLQPGDVVFFRSSPNSGSSRPPWHCGYYIGGGKYVEYYSTGKPARVSSLSSRSDYMGARRFGGSRS